MAGTWIDLLDPTAEELRDAAPRELDDAALEQLLAPGDDQRLPRPTLRGHGSYVFGVFLAAVVAPEADAVYYQEVDVVITCDAILTVRKTPPGDCPPYDVAAVRAEKQAGDGPGMIAYRLLDDIAERYLDLVDDLDGEIDDLEDAVDTQPADVTRRRLSALRHDLLRIRRTLAPTRDAVRRVVSNTVDVEGGDEIFPQPVEVAFSAVYDKLLRALDGLELSRDLLSSVRDYQQSKISIDQNEVTKRLTVIASLILIPTLIVGVYGQNFRHMPELSWHYGYAYSWGLIVLATVVQLWWFRRKGWW